MGVLAVELLVDGAVVARDERPPYGATFTVPATADRLTIGARAFDFAANAAVAAPIEVVVARAGVTTVTGVVAGPARRAGGRRARGGQRRWRCAGVAGSAVP